VRNKVESYINGELSYHAGFAIFLQLCTNPNLIRTLAQGESDRNTETLRYELGKLLPSLPEESKSPKKYISETFHVPSVEQRETLHAPINSLKKVFSDEQKTLYRERGHYHGMLHNANSDAERLELMLKLNDIQRKIDVSNGHVDKLEKGIVETAVLKKQVSAEDILRIRNLKIYIARDKKKLKALPTHELKKRAELKQRIIDWETEKREKEWITN